MVDKKKGMLKLAGCILLVLVAVVFAVKLRYLAVTNLYIDSDEHTYVPVASKYAEFMENGHLKELITCNPILNIPCLSS